MSIAEKLPPLFYENKLKSELRQMENHLARAKAAGDDDQKQSVVQNLVNEMKAALERLDAGTFGICVTCGEEIDDDRLRTMPHNAQCLDCVKAASTASETKSTEEGLAEPAKQVSPNGQSDDATSGLGEASDGADDPAPSSVPADDDTAEADGDGPRPAAEVSEDQGEGEAAVSPEPEPPSLVERAREAAAAISDGASESTEGKQFADLPIPAVHGQIQQIEVDLIDPSPDNERKEVGDVTELAQSIAAVGLLSPLIVSPYGHEGRFILVAGERRFTAVKQLGFSHVTADVREYSAKEQAEARLIENLHREDLSPLEEARGYAHLVKEHGMSQREISARLGRSQSHVSKRLALTEIPKGAQAALDSGGITLTHADELLKLREHPKAMEDAWDEASSWLEGADEEDAAVDIGFELVAAVESEMRRIKLAETTKASQEKLKAAGVKIVKEPGYNSTKVKKLGKGYGCLDIKASEHKKESCHAAFINSQTGKIGYVCTDVSRHTSEDKGGTADAPHDPRSMHQKRLDALKVEEDRRHEFIVELARKGVHLDESMKLIVAFLTRSDDLWALGEISLRDLGGWLFSTHAPDEDGERGVRLSPDQVIEKFTEFAAKSAANRERVAFALAASWCESSMEPDWKDDPRPECEKWVEFLEANGYVISELERELVFGKEEGAAAE